MNIIQLAMAHSPTEAQVRTVLAAVIDPCSRSAGVPASLEDMGLLRRIEIDGDSIDVEITLTEPMCVMGGWFLQESNTLLRARWPEATVTVAMDRTLNWTEADMTEAYVLRLAQHRAARGVAQQVVLRPRATDSKVAE
jgi:metal-sulfur cluster biosynthetic enzyme